jgi:hypothetical protein
MSEKNEARVVRTFAFQVACRIIDTRYAMIPVSMLVLLLFANLFSALALFIVPNVTSPRVVSWEAYIQIIGVARLFACASAITCALALLFLLCARWLKLALEEGKHGKNK